MLVACVVAMVFFFRRAEDTENMNLEVFWVAVSIRLNHLSGNAISFSSDTLLFNIQCPLRIIDYIDSSNFFLSSIDPLFSGYSLLLHDLNSTLWS